MGLTLKEKIHEDIEKLRRAQSMPISPERLVMLADADSFEDAVLWDDEAINAASVWKKDILERDGYKRANEYNIDIIKDLRRKLRKEKKRGN